MLVDIRACERYNIALIVSYVIGPQKNIMH